MSTPAAELRSAAFQLRNPFHGSGLTVSIDPELGAPLADWLETEAATWAGDEVHSRCSPKTCTLDAALAVARQILGGDAR